MNVFDQQAVPGVRALKPYQPGKPIDELQRELGLSQVIKLASNENPLGVSPAALNAIQQQLVETTRYPDGNGYVLKHAIAEKYNIAMEQITLGNGSNDVLELVARTFAGSNDEIIYSQYAFAIYALVTQALNAKAVVVPALNWGHDLDAMLAAVTESTKIIFIANPNNPTGTWLGEQKLEHFLNAVPSHVIVVLDEAYFEYASDLSTGAADYPNGMLWLQRFPNLIVTRTFSKAYGLAGLRVGYGVSSAEIADLLNRVRQPFNVNHLALSAATAALQDQDHLQQSVKLNANGLRQLANGFDQLGLQYIPSVGNFISVNIGARAGQVYERLLQYGIIVRPVGNYTMAEHLRVSIGREQENEAFLRALPRVLAAE